MWERKSGGVIDENFEYFDVYETVDIPEDPNAVIIDTEWVLVEKEIAQTQEYETKARLCLRRDQERNKHLIPTEYQAPLVLD